MMKHKDWQQKIATLSVKKLEECEDKEVKQTLKYFAKTREQLQKFFALLQNTDLEMLEKHNNANFNKLCKNIADLELFFDNELDQEQLRKLYHLTITSYQFLAAARRELLPLLMFHVQNNIEKEQQKIILQTNLGHQAHEQIVNLAEDFEKSDIGKLELYAPQLWSEIRSDLDFVESIAIKPDVKSLQQLNITIPKLLIKLQEAHIVSQNKEDEINNHLATTKAKLDEFIETIASLNFPLLLTHKLQQCEELYHDLEKVNNSFFYNESSPSLDYQAANARMNDSLQLLSLSIPALEEDIRKQQQHSLARRVELESKASKEKDICYNAIKFLHKKRFIAVCICMPFALLVIFIFAASSLLQDIFFVANSFTVKDIVAFHGLSARYFWFSCLGLVATGIMLFLLLQKLSLDSFSLKKVQQHSIFKPFLEQDNFVLASITKLFIFTAFVVSVSLLLYDEVNHIRLENIRKFSDKDFANIVDHVDMLSKYRTHPQPGIQDAASQTLFLIFCQHKDHPQIKEQRIQYQQNLIEQKQWQQLSQIMPSVEFVEVFSLNVDIENLDSSLLSKFTKETLQHLLPIQPRKIAFFALENLIIIEPTEAKHAEMIFSFYHDKGEKQREAIEYLLAQEQDNWMNEMLELAKQNRDVATQKLLIKGLAKLATTDKEKAQTIAVQLMFVSQNEKETSLVEIAVYGLAKMMHPSSVEYLRQQLQIIKSSPVQIQIMKTLASMKDRKAIEDMVIILCESDDYNVRKEAVYALRELGSKYYKIWKLIAQTKLLNDRKKILIKYSNHYKIIASGKYLAKLTTDKSLALFAKKTIHNIILHQRKQKSIVLIHLFANKESNTKTDRKEITKKILQTQGYSKIKMVHNLETLPEADLVIAIENGTISQERIAQLLYQGTKVLLLYNSAQVLGGKWGKGNTSNHQEIFIKPGFFSKSQRQLLLQSQEMTYFLNDPFPQNWQPDAGNTVGDTLLVQSKDDQIQGIIFTYDPQYFTKQGNEMLARVVDFLFKIDRF